MNAEAVEIVIAPGISLRGQRWAGDEMSVLLLHEPGDDRDLDRWRPLIPYLLGAGLTVIALDLRGHGASDGNWEPDQAVADIVAATIDIRRQGAERIALCAAGASAISAIRAAEQTRLDGLVLLSPGQFTGLSPRGGGEPKLLIRGGNDGATAVALRAGLIGPSLFVTVPTTERGTDLIAGDMAMICRERILAFLKELKLKGTPNSSPERVLESLNIGKRGSA